MTVHPALVLFVTAGLVGVSRRGGARAGVLLTGTLGALAAAAALPHGAHWEYSVGAYALQLLRVDPLSHLFGLIFSLIAAIGTLYALGVGRRAEHAATLVYAGGALGVVYAGDWISAFVWWELMAMASVVVVWSGNTDRARAAGFRYLFVHVAGGSLFFIGLALHLATGGSLAFGPLGGGAGLAYGLILVGVAINAAIPPLHAWLPDAYPEASITGTVFLSAFTTKTAVYVLIRVFPGSDLLVWAGIAMALYGVVYAVLENDIRRLLGYHIISQVGYMVAGVGIGTPLALGGAAAHAFCHILYKALLLMGAGAVMTATGRRKLTELGGIGRQMPLVVLLYAVGAFSISGVPLFNGFISKSMIITAAGDDGWGFAELLLTLASVGTFLHTGLKLPYFTFFGPSRGLRLTRVPGHMIAAMGLAAICCVGLGVAPGWLYARLQTVVDYHPYTLDHVAGSLQLLGGTALGFWWLLSKLAGETTESLDTDWLYRKPVPVALAWLVGVAAATGRLARVASQAVVRVAVAYAANPVSAVGRLGVGGTGNTDGVMPPYDVNRYRLPIGVTVMWVVLAVGLLALWVG
ncbi:MAG TPA: Na(+)/H(+) antiporter subunit D [Vicinamibacterales bacterium]|nr:Na(+)/H(+) antiporter subunit D [Vicinamibacterales bacterium]